MEILIGLLVICLVIALVYIVKMILKYEHIIGEYRIDLSTTKQLKSIVLDQLNDCKNELDKANQLNSELSVRVVELNGECEELTKKINSMAIPTPEPENVFSDFKKIFEESDPDAKDRLAQIQKCIFFKEPQEGDE